MTGLTILDVFIFVFYIAPVLFVTMFAAWLFWEMWRAWHVTSTPEPTLWDYEFVARQKEDEWFSLRWNAFWKLQEENKA
ncbi:MAG: hypothetical protein JRN68_06630 [Nitrososphaerota archaeon]|nr:hypothetical protein [Nitrososphaerota archaeon]